uniref:Uncharacterized protein n=1 Tax=Siphoviridae sp. ct6GI21 TaxID=2825340 RepID=A0A8S5U460_9CAUD|nr:MAG TPA: hypothetical protein [Siphoviridae sp. ct6GI21]
MAQRIVIPGFRKIETSGGGEGGTTNYDDLTNKPSINNVPLVGNLSTADLHLTDSTDTSSITLTVTNPDIKNHVPSITFAREVDSENEVKTISLSLTVGAVSGNVIGIAGTLTKEELQKLQSMKIPSTLANESYVAFFGISKTPTQYTFNLILYAQNEQGELAVVNNKTQVAIPISIKSLL